MEENLLPCNAAVRLQARIRGFTEVIYGEDHRVLHTDEISEESGEVGSGGGKGESDSFHHAATEDGLMKAGPQGTSLLVLVN